ncbi:nucleoside phosphorylase domain-containing protein [Trichoderma velutinum]
MKEFGMEASSINHTGSFCSPLGKKIANGPVPRLRRGGTISCRIPKKYTVGWIYVLSTGGAAVKALLDETYEKPTTTKDDNSYTVGRIGEHKVAFVADNMRLSYPNDAPSPSHDIRLGDIVVGTEVVVRYDSNRTADNRMTSKYPQMRKLFSRPNELSDKLYRSGFTHPINNEASCEKVCGNNMVDLVLRSERTETGNNPIIHYGPIASCSELLKDSMRRDELVQEGGVLCIEMEAARIVDQFPCFVVRGICNYYSDSHKNKIWEGYAAMVAAAYARKLLYEIQPEDIAAEPRITNICSRGI